MKNGYSKEKFMGAKNETLNPEKMKELEKFRALLARWKEIDGAGRTAGGEPIAASESILSFLKGFLEFLKPAQLEYVVGLGGVEHFELEKEYAETKKGQAELAHNEAKLFNEELDARANRLKKAIPNRKSEPEEFKNAFSEFTEFMKDLNEGNLKKYDSAISMKKEFPNRPFGKNESETVFPGMLGDDDKEKPVFMEESDADRADDD